MKSCTGQHLAPLTHATIERGIQTLPKVVVNVGASLLAVKLHTEIEYSNDVYPIAIQWLELRFPQRMPVCSHHDPHNYNSKPLALSVFRKMV